MKQQVNLYTDDFRPRGELWTLDQLAASAVILLAALFLVSLYLNVSLGRAENERDGVAERVDREEAQVDTLQQELERRQEDTALRERVERLEQRVRDRRALLERADEVAQATSEGFTPYLEGLSRQSREGLWLTGIRVNLVQGRLQLQGRTLSGERVPEYLQRLREEAVFEGRRFRHFSIERDEDHEHLGFRVSSRRPDDPDREVD